MNSHHLLFLLTLVLIIGCRQNTNHDSNAELRQLVAHTPAENIDATLQKVSRTLDLIHAEPLPEYLPNWVAFHAVLKYGERGYQNQQNNENLMRIFPVLQVSETQELGSFTLRGGLPYPLYSGPYFMQEHHPDQFLHYFTMAGGTLDALLTIDGKGSQKTLKSDNVSHVP